MLQKSSRLVIREEIRNSVALGRHNRPDLTMRLVQTVHHDDRRIVIWWEDDP